MNNRGREWVGHELAFMQSQRDRTSLNMEQLHVDIERDVHLTRMDLPGKALSPGMRSSLEPMDFSPGAAAVHEEEEEAKKSLFF